MIIVEKPGIGDAEEIAQVHRTSWHETYDGILPAQSIEELLNSSEKAQIIHFRDVAMGKKPEHLLLVARNEKGIVGFCDALKNDDLGEMKAIYIVREFQRQGIGSEFMKYVFFHLRETKEVFADLLRENIPAIRFFERHGFSLSGNQEFIRGINLVTMIRRMK